MSLGGVGISGLTNTKLGCYATKEPGLRGEQDLRLRWWESRVLPA